MRGCHGGEHVVDHDARPSGALHVAKCLAQWAKPSSGDIFGADACGFHAPWKPNGTPRSAGQSGLVTWRSEAGVIGSAAGLILQARFHYK
jgi:hypothetical protein